MRADEAAQPDGYDRAPMLSLLSDRFAPTTSNIGFLGAPLERAAEELVAWEKEFSKKVKATPLQGGLEELLPHLEPLTEAVRPRELVVSTAGEWTAYFDCGALGTDATSAISYMCSRIGCHGLGVSCVPNTAGTQLETPGRYGGVTFELFAPHETRWGNTLRGISVTNEFGKWHFVNFGQVQDFERTEAYSARRVRDRFTSEMLAEYCEALGIRLFDPSFYRDGVLIESRIRRPFGAKRGSFADIQKEWGIVPGAVDQVPG